MAYDTVSSRSPPVDSVMRFERTRSSFRQLARGILLTHRLYTHVFLVTLSTVSGIEAALVHSSSVQITWILVAATSAASVTVIEGTARSGNYHHWTIPRKMPEPPAFFVGRSKDILSVEEKFAEQRNARRSDRASYRNEPAVIYIHGPLGIGKSALAVVLARKIARHFPDGVLTANLGEVGSPRGPSEVLGSFLDELQSPASSLDTQKRAELFQEICAHRKILVILDAAQDGGQIAALLPRSSDCAAIVTSRLRIGGASSYLLQALNAGDAVEMLYSYAGAPSNTSAESAAEIVELCGRLPLALRSAGEQLANNSSFDDLVRLLRPREGRLAQLDHGGHLIEERIRSEYDRLNERDRTAFCRLALLRSTTFLPWVLVPLLEVDFEEAGNIITRLAKSQLVQIADHDPSGLKRYRLHPLMWCFAHVELRKDAGRSGAEIRFEEYQLNVISEILVRHDPSLESRLERRLNRTQSHGDKFDWLQRVAQAPSYWSRAEYGSLVEGIETSFRQGEWELCWRIAAQLGSCVPRYLDADYYLQSFDLALAKAAEARDRPEEELIEILITENDTSRRLEHWQDDEVYRNTAQRYDSTRFRSYLGLSETARRKGIWQEARQFLENAMAPSYGDARRRASVEYRHGRLCLSQWRAESFTSVKPALATAAVGHSALALVRFQSMDNFIGCLRARCLLARALIAAEQPLEAATQIERAREEAERLNSIPADMRTDILLPCLARIARAEGELRVKLGHFRDAQQHLEEASEAFRQLSDGWSRADTLLLLGKAYKGSGQYTRAMSCLYESRVSFERCNDYANLVETIREQGRVAREQNKYAVADDYETDIISMQMKMSNTLAWRDRS